MLELWFDFSCPYAYLASRCAPALAARLGVPLAWRPMLLGGVFRGTGAGDGPMATLSPVRAAYNQRDMHRWAERLGVPLRIPPAHPMRTVRALRVLLGLPEISWPAAIAAIYAAYWERGEDVTSDAVLAAALHGIAGLDAAFASADSDAIKAELRRRTDEAIALGIFGAPAWIIGRTLIWGQDRLPWVEATLRGWDPDHSPVDRDLDHGVAPTLDLDGDGVVDPTVDLDAGPPRSTLDFYFDVSSPFSYFALTQLATLHAEVRLHPILLGGLFRAIGTPDVPLFSFPPAKRQYISLEMQRWARWWRVPFRFPSKFPQRTIKAQRLILLAAAHGAAAQLGLALALGRALWADDRDLEDEPTLAAILTAEHLPAADLLAQTRDAATKAALVAETTAAAAAGVFGVPSYVVDGHLVWGPDRLELVTGLLSGWRPAHG